MIDTQEMNFAAISDDLQLSQTIQTISAKLELDANVIKDIFDAKGLYGIVSDILDLRRSGFEEKTNFEPTLYQKSILMYKKYNSQLINYLLVKARNLSANRETDISAVEIIKNRMICDPKSHFYRMASAYDITLDTIAMLMFLPKEVSVYKSLTQYNAYNYAVLLIVIDDILDAMNEIL